MWTNAKPTRTKTVVVDGQVIVADDGCCYRFTKEGNAIVCYGIVIATEFSLVVGRHGSTLEG